MNCVITMSVKLYSTKLATSSSSTSATPTSSTSATPSSHRNWNRKKRYIYTRVIENQLIFRSAVLDNRILELLLSTVDRMTRAHVQFEFTKVHEIRSREPTAQQTCWSCPQHAKYLPYQVIKYIWQVRMRSIRVVGSFTPPFSHALLEQIHDSFMKCNAKPCRFNYM